MTDPTTGRTGTEAAIARAAARLADRRPEGVFTDEAAENNANEEE